MVNYSRHFDVLDYTIFAIMLVISALIGIYFAFFAKQKQNTTSEYLVGGRKMGIFPISMSLIASHISGIALIGIPSEIYVYGTQFWVLTFAEILTCLFMSFVIMPVFYNLQIISTYEYLNQRYNGFVRSIGSFFFICKMMLYIPIVVYVPALAFAHVSGVSLDILIPVICIVCIFYTTLGGIKAVVWTDTVQIMLMITGVVTVAILGTISAGGFAEVWRISEAGGRIEFFNFSWDPTIRHTFWNIMIGKFFHHMSTCTINQAMVQRCLAMPTLKKAQITIAIYSIGVSIFVHLTCYTGLVIYAAFHDCDPLKSGILGKADQLLPYFVMNVTNHIPALPGIFVSGVFSAALSTMSTGLNSMCGVILEDFIKPYHKQPLSEERASYYMKAITVVLGLLCIALAFVVGNMGGVIQSSASLASITAGSLLGMFLLGMLFPWANATGALVGGFTAAVLVGWQCVGTQLAVSRRLIVYPKKPTTIDGCQNSVFHPYLQSEPGDYKDIFVSYAEPVLFYRISYVYYTLIGVVIVVVVGIIVSYFTGFNDPNEMDPNVFSPVIKKYFQRKKKDTNNLVTDSYKKTDSMQLDPLLLEPEQLVTSK